MFLELIKRRNPALIGAAVELHQSGEIPAGSYVLDVDAIGANAAAIAGVASGLGLRAYAMTKQIGRNPVAIEAIQRNGIEAGVAVDVACARAIDAAGMAVGHLGHLVQIPDGNAAEAAALHPAHWTVFSPERAERAASATARIGREQALLARIQAEGDHFYPGHEGGFAAEDVLAVADRFDQLQGGRFAGVTTFPALLFDRASGEARPTPNLATLERAAGRLRASGRTDVEVNAPGTTSASTLPVLAAAGATQVEPGHALTGTTPPHAVSDLPERPAMLYLTEVSHTHGGRAYCFGNGLYVDPVFPDYQVRALLGASAEEALGNTVDAYLPPATAIDYYGQLDAAAATGDSVVFGFRAQAFVTRAAVAAVSGIAAGAPRLEGLFGPDGRRLEGVAG